MKKNLGVNVGLFCGLLLFLQVIHAQQTGTLRGSVYDAMNGEILAYANILIELVERGASTDLNGFFVISSLAANRKYKVRVSYIGYHSKEIETVIEAGKVTHQDIALEPQSVELQAVEIASGKIIEKNETDLGLHRIKIKELEKMPHGGETDIIRSITFQPGVRTTGDVSAKYYVRGGAGNQNLVLFEGVTIYNPYHAMGLFSAFDPEMINNAEFYKGGFGAEFGGRLSSVLNLVSKDGNRYNYSVTAGASSLTGKFLLEGPIPYGSFFITGRKSYKNNIVKNYLDNTPPLSFYDASFRVSFSHPDFAPISKFTFFGLFTHDAVIQDSPFREDFNWSNNVFGFKWLKAGEDTPFFYEITLSYSQFKGELNPKLSNTKPRNNELSDITLDMKFNYIFDSRDEIIIGLKYSDLRNKLLLKNDVGYLYDRSQKGSNIVFWGKYRLMRFENFGIDAGVRLNLAGFSENGGGFLEPRLNMTYRLSDDLALKAAVGIYQQELITLTDDNDILSIFEPWLITPHYMEPTRAVDYSAGIDWNVFEGLSLEVGGYYKNISNLPEVNRNKIFITDPDFIEVEGESYGVESEMKIVFHPVSIRAVYTHSYAYYEEDGFIYRPNYDSQHSANLSLEIDLGKGWLFGSIWNYASGLPFTQTLGYYEKLYPDNIPDQNFIFDSYLPFLLLAEKNRGQMAPYHRIDISLSKKLQILFFDVDFNLGLVNLFNRENIFYIRRETGEKIYSLPFLPTASVRVKI